MGTGRQSEQGYLRWITTKGLDVLLHPLKEQDLVTKSEIQHTFLCRQG